MLEFLKFSLISSAITFAAAIVMVIYSKFDLDFEDIYNDGVNLYKKKQYRNAINKFKHAIIKNPNKSIAHYNLGLCELKLKNYKNACMAFSKAYELNKLDLDTIYNLAYSEMLLKKYDSAKNYFNKIIDSYPDEADVLFNLGFIAKGQNDTDLAKDYLLKAIELDPNNNDYKLYYIDLLEESLKNTLEPDASKNVLDIVKDLLVILPENENLLYKAVILYAKLGEWENSVTYCEKLVTINPNSYKAYCQYGLALFCKGENKQAIEMYEKAIKIAPNLPDTYLNLAFAYDKVGQKEDAIQITEIFIKKFPNNDMIEIAKDFLRKKENEDD